MEFNASFQNPFSSRLLQFLLYDYLHPFELNFGNLVLTLKSSYPPGQPNVNTTGFLFPQILILNIVELSYRDKAMQIVSTTTHRLQHPWLVPHCISHGILTTGQKSMCMTPKVHRALESTVSVHTRWKAQGIPMAMGKLWCMGRTLNSGWDARKDMAFRIKNISYRQ